MREKPIIFSTQMVQAILDGRKTQTRRVVKPQFPAGLPEGKYRYDGVQEGIHGIELLDADGKPTEKYFPCGKLPFVPDDILWVRETIAWLVPIREKIAEYIYKADNPDLDALWSPAIHMPRIAARIFLRVTDVRVERLQDITNDDAIKEGFEGVWFEPDGWTEPPTVNFMYTWDSLNAKRGFGWESNPWVWVIAFERTEPCRV